MVDQSPIEFEDIPLENARLMGRGPRMEPLLYDTLKQEIQALSEDAVRIRLGPEITEITQQRMRNYLLRIARELNVPVTVRRVPGGVLVWRSSNEDMQAAQEISTRLRGTRTKRSRARGGRRRTGTRART
jgi:hypothetical protein